MPDLGTTTLSTSTPYFSTVSRNGRPKIDPSSPSSSLPSYQCIKLVKFIFSSHSKCNIHAKKTHACRTGFTITHATKQLTHRGLWQDDAHALELICTCHPDALVLVCIDYPRCRLHPAPPRRDQPVQKLATVFEFATCLTAEVQPCPRIDPNTTAAGGHECAESKGMLQQLVMHLGIALPARTSSQQTAPVKAAQKSAVQATRTFSI